MNESELHDVNGKIFTESSLKKAPPSFLSACACHGVHVVRGQLFGELIFYLFSF